MRIAVFVSAAAVSCVLFTYSLPPNVPPDFYGFLGNMGLSGLDDGSALYIARFALSFSLLGLAPLAVALLAGMKPRRLGLCAPRGSLSLGAMLFFCAVMLVSGAVGAWDGALSSYYPYAKRLGVPNEWPWLLPHLAAYALFYYLPWEFFFRGFLLFGLHSGTGEALDLPAANDGKKGGILSVFEGLTPEAILCVMVAVLPSTLLHFGHPLTETLAAIPAGALFGLVAWRERSIVPALALHALAGIGTDLAIVLRVNGVLP